MSPNNLQLWYNLALARETFAVAVLQKEQKGEARTLAEVENAIEDLKVRLSPILAPNVSPTHVKPGSLRAHVPSAFVLLFRLE